MVVTRAGARSGPSENDSPQGGSDRISPRRRKRSVRSNDESGNAATSPEPVQNVKRLKKCSSSQEEQVDPQPEIEHDAADDAEDRSDHAASEDAAANNDAVEQVGQDDADDSCEGVERILFHDMVGKERTFSTALSAFLVPFPTCTPPQTLVHFVCLYVIRNERRRVFPRDIQVSLLTDFANSTWIQDRYKTANTDEVLLSEHEPHVLRVLLKKQFLLFPFLAENCYSLVVVQDLQQVIELLTTLIRLESTLPTTVVAEIKDATLLQRVTRFDRFISVDSLKSCSIFHLDWNGKKHDTYRPSLRSWVVEMCFLLVDDLTASCTKEVLLTFVEEHVDLKVPKIWDPPKEAYDSAWKVVQYLLVMLHEPAIDPETGKRGDSERKRLLNSNLKDSNYGHIPFLRSIGSRAVKNMLTAKSDPRISPFPALWGGALASLVRDVNDPLTVESRIILPNCLPVVLEFCLKAVDDYINRHKERFQELFSSRGSEVDGDNIRSTDDAKHTTLSFASSREKACKELLPTFEEHVWIERHGMKPRDRSMRFWKSVFDHVVTLPPYRESANIFNAMRSFPDSVSVCLGLEYLHAKEHRLFFYNATPPNLRQGDRPWKLFDHSSKNLKRSNQWFERRAWSRMHEAGVIIFAVTEFIFRCATNREVKTETELAALLKQVQLEREEFMSSVVTCPVNLRDIVHHMRKRKENVDAYKKKVTTRLQDAVQATKLSFTTASDAFKSSLIPFASAYGVKRAVQGLNVAVCKLKTIPDNMLDLLWQNVTNLMKETLTTRERKGEFRFNAGENCLDVESQLIRLFRIMNSVFVRSADTLLKDVFKNSAEKLQLDISSFMSEGGTGMSRRLQKLKAIPSGALWNFVDSRFSGGYLSSAVMGAPSGDGFFEDPFRRNVRLSPAYDGQYMKDSDISRLQALSAQGIPSRSVENSESGIISLTPLFDVGLAMKMELVPCLHIHTANFGWGLLASLSCILQKIPGHVQSAQCFTRNHTSCAPKPSAVNACLDVLSRIAEKVKKTWVMGFGIDSLQTQSIFVRFDAITSAALTVAGSKEYWCRPSIEANICEMRDEEDDGNRNAPSTAFMGYPTEIDTENEGIHSTKLRGTLLRGTFQRLNHPEQQVRTEPSSSSHASGERRQRKIISVDFLNLSAHRLPSPKLHKMVMQYFLETPDFSGERLYDRSGEINFQVGDVFWLSMISVGRANKGRFVGSQGYSGSHLGVMMTPAQNIAIQSQSRDRRVQGPSPVHKEQVAAILFLPRDRNREESDGFQYLFDKMSSRGLQTIPHGPRDQVIRMIPTGINIETELTTFHVTFRRSHYLPIAINLASVHPRLLQLHTQKVLAILHRTSSLPDRYNGIVPTMTPADHQERMRQEMSKVLEAMFPRLKPEQLQAISIPLLWIRLVQSSFFDSSGNPHDATRNIFNFDYQSNEVKYIGANAFFIRGPPGTGKSYVITSLICAGLFGHSSEEDVQKSLPKCIKRIMVVTHTNAAIDDILNKVAKARQFKDGDLVRVGIRGKNSRYTTIQVYQRRIKKEQSKREERNNNRPRAFPSFSESDVIDDALVVFSTFGSLQRSEFTTSLKGFQMLIIEEAGKLPDGDLLAGVAYMTGMKNEPPTGSPLAVVMVGDEKQLPPHTKLDPNLNVPRLCPAPLFDRYVSKFREIPSPFDFNSPVTLLTQHRAHRSIANIHSHFAYRGRIQTGARESWERWKTDEMEKRIGESQFKFRTVSIVSYRGTLHSDVRGVTSSFGGNTNQHEYNLIFNICKDWCSRSKKFNNRITILSPYKAQVEKLKRLLADESKHPQQNGLATIEVHTVDSSQGLENDIVILSLVRTHRSQRQAFLDNPYRINVMLSRARERLVIVGARDEISAISSNWTRLYAIIDELAREEKQGHESEASESDSETKEYHYGFYDAVSDNLIYGPKDIDSS